ncbi:MAG: biotin--[acetyl-CoA-carboxylase] ligase, partial [Bacteroidota bacterium]
VIITADQNQGKGQRGNIWLSEPYKNLTFSLVLKPTFLKAEFQFQLSMLSSLAVRNFMSAYLSAPVYVKWPNDIICQEKKLCGILIENQIRRDFLDYSIVGIGMNINQSHFSLPQASSLKLLSGQTYDLESLFQIFLEQFEKAYLQLKTGGVAELRQAYLEHLFQIGEETEYLDQDGQAFRGSIKGINASGQLLIQTAGGLIPFNHQEIRYTYG